MKENLKIFKEALKYIPLASQTYSKSHKVHFKGISPLFLKRGKGCYVWDEDNRKYIDLICALLPVIIGYSNNKINNVIIKQLKNKDPIAPDIVLLGLILVNFGPFKTLPKI